MSELESTQAIGARAFHFVPSSRPPSRFDSAHSTHCATYRKLH